MTRPPTPGPTSEAKVSLGMWVPAQPSAVLLQEHRRAPLPEVRAHTLQTRNSAPCRRFAQVVSGECTGPRQKGLAPLTCLGLTQREGHTATPAWPGSGFNGTL